MDVSSPWGCENEHSIHYTHSISSNDNCTMLLISVYQGFFFQSDKNSSTPHPLKFFSSDLSLSLYPPSLFQLSEPGEISFWLNDFFLHCGNVAMETAAPPTPTPPRACVCVCIGEWVVVLTIVSSPQHCLRLCSSLAALTLTVPTCCRCTSRCACRPILWLLFRSPMRYSPYTLCTTSLNISGSIQALSTTFVA